MDRSLKLAHGKVRSRKRGKKQNIHVDKEGEHTNEDSQRGEEQGFSEPTISREGKKEKRKRIRPRLEELMILGFPEDGGKKRIEVLVIDHGGHTTPICMYREERKKRKIGRKQ